MNGMLLTGGFPVNSIADNDLKLVFSKLDSIREIPTLPAIALRAVEISNDEASSAKELARFISQDQSLTATLLTMVNAAAYGVAGNISTVDRAVIIMGFDKVRTMVLLSTVADFFSDVSDCLDPTELWRHSIGAATAAGILARDVPGVDPGAAYIAGLLHEVGIVVIDLYFHEDFRAAVELAAARKCSIDRALRDLVGYDQFRIGGYLARRWRLPGALAGAIGLHNDPPRTGNDSQIVAIAHIASMIADICNMSFDPLALKRPVSSVAIELLGVTPARIKAAVDELDQHRARIEEFAELCSRPAG